MPKFLLAVLFLMISKSAICQLPVLQWAKAFTSTVTYNRDHSNGRSVAVDLKGNVISAGNFENEVDFDPGPGTFTMSAEGFGGNSIYISKLGPNGDFIWAKQLPIVVSFANVEIDVDKKGNVYLVADFNQPTDVDPGPAIHMLTPIGGENAFLLKLDADGNFLWAKQFGGTGRSNSTALHLGADDNVLMCGTFSDNIDFDPGSDNFELSATGQIEAFIVKLTEDGDFIWATQTGNFSSPYSSVYFSDINCDVSGNVYTTGQFTGACDFDPGSGVYRLSSDDSNDAFVCKLDNNGNFQWAKKIGSSANYNYVIPRGIAVDADNNVYTTGYFIGLQDFDPGTSVYNLGDESGVRSVYLLKLGHDGDFIWGKYFVGGVGADVITDNSNNVYITGLYDGTIDFDPGPGTYLVENLYDECVLTKFTRDGDFIYAAPFRAMEWASDLTNRMVTDAAQSIYITGHFSGTVDFDPGPDIYPVSGTSDYSPFVLKLSRCKNVTASSLTITTCNNYTLNNTLFDSSGTYTQVIPNTSGCDSIITLNLTINKKFSSRSEAICEGESFYIGGIQRAIAGIYKDTLLTSTGCDSIVTISLTVNPKPVPDLGADQGLCNGTQLTVTPGLFKEYFWQNKSTASSLTIDTSGLFWVKVTNSFDCSATDSLKISSIFASPANFLKRSDSLCTYNKLQIKSMKSYQNYLWSTGEPTDNISVESPGIYWLTVTDDKGCIGKDSISVFPKECITGVFVPTAFTPNGDGKNDIFKALVHRQLSSFKLEVFDRFGQLVFQTSDPAKGWTGINKVGMPYPTTTFVWQCFYQIQDKPAEYQKGTVLLIR